MKNQKGITLIALVVTIIVLLILAGISIAMLTGDNGIITRTNDSKMSQIEGQVKEEVKLAIQSAKIFATQKSVETTGGGWFADENDQADGYELKSVVNEMRADLKRALQTNESAAPADITDSCTLANLKGYNVSAQYTSAPSTITVKYTSDDYKAATNDTSAYIEAVINVTDNNFKIFSFAAKRAGDDSTTANGKLKDLNDIQYD